MKELNKKLQERLEEMVLTGHLFRSTITGEQIWDTYLKGFGEDPVFRDPSSSVHNCKLCNNFIRRYGNIIAFDENYELMTLWDIKDAPEEYAGSVKAVHDLLKTGGIQDIFIETFEWLNKSNFEKTNKSQRWFKLSLPLNVKKYTKEEALKYPAAGLKEGDTRTFNHLSISLPDEFVDKSGKSREALMSEPRDKAKVFKRGLTEIPMDTMLLVRDLEAQGSLLNGISYKHIVLGAIKVKEEYDKLPTEKRDAFVWVNSQKLGAVATFRNNVAGVLMVELSEGKELNEAVKAFNQRVDPVNYMKAKAPITKKQIAEAEKFVEENGYAESFERRCATIDDINVSEILHSNVTAAETKTKVSVFAGVKSTAPTRHKRSEFDGVQEVPIEKFMTEILPTCTSVEVFLQNKHKGNFVNLLTSVNKESKGIFKWLNNFSWTYSGNLAGKSQLAEMVQQRGGSISGVIRFTHSWNELDRNESLMDAHVFMPGYDEGKFGGHRVNDYYPSTRRVGWNNRTDRLSGGVQDVDYVQPAPKGFIPVENITFPDINKMPKGKYLYVIHNWNFRNSGGRGRAEIAFGNEIYQYIYPSTKMKEWVPVAEVTLHEDNTFTIRHILPLASGSETSEKIYGLDTCEFHKVSLLCLSPNYWQEHGVGNKHYFFMLEGAQSPEEIRSIHNEFLNDDLRAHRKVMEVLGSTLRVESTKGQLCGLGFNSTVRDEVILRLGGSHKRVIKVKI